VKTGRKWARGKKRSDFRLKEGKSGKLEEEKGPRSKDSNPACQREKKPSKVHERQKREKVRSRRGETTRCGSPAGGNGGKRGGGRRLPLSEEEKRGSDYREEKRGSPEAFRQEKKEESFPFILKVEEYRIKGRGGRHSIGGSLEKRRNYQRRRTSTEQVGRRGLSKPRGSLSGEEKEKSGGFPFNFRSPQTKRQSRGKRLGDRGQQRSNSCCSFGKRGGGTSFITLAGTRAENAFLLA